MPSPATVVLQQKVEWASGCGIAIDSSGFALELDDDLFEPLSPETSAEYGWFSETLRADGIDCRSLTYQSLFRAFSRSSSAMVISPPVPRGSQNRRFPGRGHDNGSCSSGAGGGSASNVVLGVSLAVSAGATLTGMAVASASSAS